MEREIEKIKSLHYDTPEAKNPNFTTQATCRTNSTFLYVKKSMFNIQRELTQIQN